MLHLSPSEHFKFWTPTLRSRSLGGPPDLTVDYHGDVLQFVARIHLVYRAHEWINDWCEDSTGRHTDSYLSRDVIQQAISFAERRRSSFCLDALRVALEALAAAQLYGQDTIEGRIAHSMGIELANKVPELQRWPTPR